MLSVSEREGIDFSDDDKLSLILFLENELSTPAVSANSVDSVNPVGFSRTESVRVLTSSDEICSSE